MNTTRFALLFLAACATSEIDDVTAPSGGKADDALTTRGLPASLPAWGGSDPAKWSPEAIIANAVTAELKADPTARVSIPATLWTSHYAPFGDGQTNAAASFAYWQTKRVPVIGVRSAGRVEVRFDRALPISDDTFELWSPEGVWMKSVASTKTSDGDRVIEFAALERVVISPRGWRDAFALSFAMPIASIASLPDANAKLPGGEPVVDPVGAAGDGYDVLRATSFPAGFNQMPYVTDNLHAAFPQSGAPRITAVGGAWTWVTEQPFKNMYVCMEPRALDREAQYGVPSGAGWHQIGAVPEAIVSSVATEPLLVGYASAPATVASGGTFAYGLDRATTYGLLQPGQAFTAPSGDFHWYAVHHAQKPCVQIWAR
jgi:hypothetical protein